MTKKIGSWCTNSKLYCCNMAGIKRLQLLTSSKTRQTWTELNDIYQFFASYRERFFFPSAWVNGAYGLGSLINLNILGMFSTHTERVCLVWLFHCSQFWALPKSILPYDQMSNVLNYSLLTIFFFENWMQRARNFKLFRGCVYFHPACVHLFTAQQ